jgi:dihydropteroate synthase
MASSVAESGATLVLTHSLQPPRSEPPRPEYGDVVDEVVAFLLDRVARAVAAGVPRERLIVDPGHDLNKNTFHTLELTRRLEEVAALGLPMLVAVSNKDFIGETLDRAKDERLEGTLATAVICILKGARIVRMHDVRAAVAAVRMTEAILGFRGPAYAIHNRGEA